MPYGSQDLKLGNSVLETKGIHLKGSDDTSYKKNLLAILEEAYSTASERGQMKIGKPPATFRLLFEERWPGQVSALLNEPYRKGERRDC